VRNGAAPAELTELLRAEEQALRLRLQLAALAAEARIQAWREAYRKFGAKPGDFRSSVEAMARRVLRGESLPAINALVDIGNLLSLRHLTPVGGHAIDVLSGDIALRLAHGAETFVPFGTDQAEHPPAGEVIFAEGDRVLTRRWTWRQAEHTLTLPGTRAIAFNVDGLPPVTRLQVEAACSEVIALVGRFCGGDLRSEVLSVENASICISP